MIEQFELWARSKELDLTLAENTAYPDFTYADIETEMFWECWQVVWNLAIETELSKARIVFR